MDRISSMLGYTNPTQSIYSTSSIPKSAQWGKGTKDNLLCDPVSKTPITVFTLVQVNSWMYQKDMVPAKIVTLYGTPLIDGAHEEAGILVASLQYPTTGQSLS